MQASHQALDRFYLRSHHQPPLPPLDRDTRDRRDRIRLLPGGHPPQPGPTASHHRFRSPQKRSEVADRFVALSYEEGHWFRTLEEPHGAPADQLPQGSPARTGLGEQDRGSAATIVLSHELEELSLPRGAAQVRRLSLLDDHPLGRRPLRRRRRERNPPLCLARPQSLAPERTLQGCALDYSALLPGPAGGGFEYQVTAGIQAGRQGRAQHDGQRDGGGLRYPPAQF